MHSLNWALGPDAYCAGLLMHACTGTVPSLDGFFFFFRAPGAILADRIVLCLFYGYCVAADAFGAFGPDLMIFLDFDAGTCGSGGGC